MFPKQIKSEGQRSVAVEGTITESVLITGDVHINWNATSIPKRPAFKRYLRALAVIPTPVVGRSVDDPPPVSSDLWEKWQLLEKVVHSAWGQVRQSGFPWGVIRLNPPTQTALIDALAVDDATRAYQIVYFSGHSTGNSLVLEDELGCAREISFDDVVAHFRGQNIQLVILDAVQTQTLAQRLHTEANIPAVITLTEKPQDSELYWFFSCLLAQLARGQSVFVAFNEAIKALQKAYQNGELHIPSDLTITPTEYIAERLTIPVLLGDVVLPLPPIGERAESPLLFLSEPPSRGMEMRLVDGFVGRGAELVKIATWLRERPTSVIAISGLGGIGKSALATVAILRGSWRFRAVVMLSARNTPTLSPKDLLPLVDSVLQMEGALTSIPVVTEQWSRTATALNENPVLILLDNLEDLNALTTRAWTQFLRLLDPRRGSLVVLTLRPAVKHPLTDLAEPAHLPLERLSLSDALRLLANGIGTRRLWDKVPQAENLSPSLQKSLLTLAKYASLDTLSLEKLASLQELALRAGRHPLALRLALGDLNYPHVDWVKVLANLSDLQGRDWQAQAEAMIGRMIADLEKVAPLAVSVLQALLVFQGGATYDALQTVAISGQEQITFDDHLRAVLDASLLELPRPNRYDLHPLTRAYLSQGHQLNKTTWEMLRRRHALFFANWLETNGDFDVLEAELPNLRHGLSFVTTPDTRDDKLIIDYASLHDMLQIRGHWDDVLHLMTETAQASANLGYWEDEAAAYNNIAGVHIDQGNFVEALGFLKKVEKIDKINHNNSGLGSTYNGIGTVYMNSGNLEQALKWLNKALILHKETENIKGQAFALSNLGHIYFQRGDYTQALAYLEQAEPMFAQMGAQHSLAMVHNNLVV